MYCFSNKQWHKESPTVVWLQPLWFSGGSEESSCVGVSDHPAVLRCPAQWSSADPLETSGESRTHNHHSPITCKMATRRQSLEQDGGWSRAMAWVAADQWAPSSGAKRAGLFRGTTCSTEVETGKDHLCRADLRLQEGVPWNCCRGSKNWVGRPSLFRLGVQIWTAPEGREHLLLKASTRCLSLMVGAGVSLLAWCAQATRQNIFLQY